ncbi:MAG: CoA transferase [Chloroflexota bacterium]
MTNTLTTDAANGPLTGYRVLDLAGPIGFHGVKLLADMGAGVVKIEPPAGDPARLTPPFKDDLPHRERSLYFLHYNSNKRGITLDLTQPDGRDIFLQLARRADAVIESMAPGGMDALGIGYEAVRAVNPGVVYAAVTPFGQTGPWRDYQGTDLVGLALSNTLAMSGEPDEPPVEAPGEIAYGMTGTYAALGVAIALYHRHLRGEGQYVDISMHECGAHVAGYAIPLYSVSGVKPFRTSRTGAVADLFDVFKAKDGYVRFFIVQPHQWRHLVRWIGEPAEPISDPLFDDMEWRRQNIDLVHGIIAGFAAQYTKRELYEEGQRRRIGVSSVDTPAEYVDSPQTQARGLFVPMQHPVVGDYLEYGPIPGLSATPGRIIRPAPLLGQHNVEIYSGELGLSTQDLAALAAAGVV